MMASCFTVDTMKRIIRDGALIPAALMRLLIAVAAAAAAAAPTEDDAAAATCLVAPNATCDADAPCGARAYSRSCLRLRVPWQTPYERVRCCLRCCLLHWVGALGLRDNFDRNKIPGARPDEMLLGFGLESTMGFAALRKPLLLENA